MAYQVKKAASLEEAFKWLEQPGACLIAGGTDRIPRINQGIERHGLLVCLEGIPELLGVSVEQGYIRIGALTRLAQIAKAPLLEGFNALLSAAGKVASPPIRNQGTVGGNILQENRCMYFNQSVSWRRVESCYKLGGDRCYQYKGSPKCVALMQSDLAPVLLAHGASVVLAGPQGERELSIEELYLPAGQKNMRRNEILTEIRLQRTKARLHSAYVRETIRGSFDFPLVSCAVVLEEEDGVISSASMTMGSAGDMPKRVMETKTLIGLRVEEVAEQQQALIEAGRKKVAPFRDSRVDAATRRAMGEWVIKCALEQAIN